MNLQWIRDCWSLFVLNLPSIVSTKALYDLFREVGFVFDVFVPRHKSNGVSRGFGFVHFKTEWDARKAISLFHGRVGGGNCISVQMAEFDNRNSGGSRVQLSRWETRRSVPGGGADWYSIPVDGDGKREIGVGRELSLHVVKVPEGVSSALKKEVCDCFVATALRRDTCATKVEGWFQQVLKVAFEVKHLTSILLWVRFLLLSFNGSCLLHRSVIFY